MCELLAMSANALTDLKFSFQGLLERGGRTGPHKDGWGIAFYEKESVHLFKDSSPSIHSPMAQFLISTLQIKSYNVIAHVRQANVGEINLNNTHPFSHNLWGKNWVYAHNGQLNNHHILPTGNDFKPIGTTDSEHLFAWLIFKLKHRFFPPQTSSDYLKLFDYISMLLRQIEEKFGICNVLLSNGEYLYAFCSTKLHYITRRSPFGEAILKDIDVSIDFSTCTTTNDIVTVLATEPLTTNETWTALNQSCGYVFKNGILEQTFEG